LFVSSSQRKSALVCFSTGEMIMTVQQTVCVNLKHLKAASYRITTVFFTGRLTGLGRELRNSKTLNSFMVLFQKKLLKKLCALKTNQYFNL